jgi:hypothetical protein
VADSPLPSERVPAVPIAPAAVQRVVDALARLFANDELTEEDLEVRLERVYAATTFAELHAVLADLPADLAAGTAAPVAVAERGTGAITAWFAGQQRKISGTVPRTLQVRARLGYIELDLTHATLEPGVTTIDVRPFMGYVQIRLPAGCRVESEGRALFGYFALKGSEQSDVEEAASVVRLTGRAVFGYAECNVAGPQRLEPGG